MEKTLLNCLVSDDPGAVCQTSLSKRPSDRSQLKANLIKCDADHAVDFGSQRKRTN